MLIDARIIVMPVDDLDHALRWYTDVLRFAPTRVTAEYLAFNAGCYELRLVRQHWPREGRPTGQMVYWRVADIEVETNRWLRFGATREEPARGCDCIGRVAAFRDPFGNVVGLVQEHANAV